MNSEKFKIKKYACCVCFLLAFTLSGCTKEESQYELDSKFVYNDSQESAKIIVEENSTTEESLAVDSIGTEEIDYDNGVIEMEMDNGGIIIIQEFDNGIPEMPDVPLQDLENYEQEVATEEPVTEAEVEDAPPAEMTTEEQPLDVEEEAPPEETTETEVPPSTEEVVDDAPATEEVTTEIVPEEVTTEEPSTEDPSTETPPSDETSEETPSTEDAPSDDATTEAPSEDTSTELPGDESGAGDSTEETPSEEPSDNPGGTGDGENGEDGSDENLPGDSDDASGGTGESGSGETGGGDSGGGETGGEESGDNGTGNNDEGTGGSGEGGNGEGGDGEIGGDEPTDPGIGGNPEEVVKIWYEGTLGTYIWGETVDTSDLTVYAEFGDGRTEEVEAYSVNMNYPERSVVTELVLKMPVTYQPGVYNATIAYQNQQVECPYNLIAHFVMVTVVHYGSCSDPEGHNAEYRENEAGFDSYVCDWNYDCFDWYIDDEGRRSTTTSVHEPTYFPVYYDYDYTIEDLLNDDYYANVFFDFSTATLTGNSIHIYKDTVISEGYYSYTFSNGMNIIYEDMEKMYEIVESWEKTDNK